MNKSRIGYVFFYIGVILMLLNAAGYLTGLVGWPILPRHVAMTPIGAAFFVIGIGLIKKKR
jgi:hypothetical protein